MSGTPPSLKHSRASTAWPWPQLVASTSRPRCGQGRSWPGAGAGDGKARPDAAKGQGRSR